MSSIYLVTSGSYSDYGVEAAFSTKEKAQEYIDEHLKIASCYADPKEIAEYSLDEPRAHISYVYVTMSKTGEVLNDPTVDTLYSAPWMDGFVVFSSGRWREDSMETIRWCVITNDITKAIKVVNEKRTQIIAEGLWMDSARVMEAYGQCNV